MKHRKTGGRPRLRCKSCSSTQTRSNDTRARGFAVFLDFVTGRHTLRDHGFQARTLRRHNELFWHLWPASSLVDEVHHVVFVYGIYLFHTLVALIACMKTHFLGWYVAKGETTRAWQCLIGRIGVPDVVGLLMVWLPWSLLHWVGKGGCWSCRRLIVISSKQMLWHWWNRGWVGARCVPIWGSCVPGFKNGSWMRVWYLTE